MKIERLVIDGKYGRKKFHYEVDNPTKVVIAAWKRYCKTYLDKYTITLRTYKIEKVVRVKSCH